MNCLQLSLELPGVMLDNLCCNTVVNAIFKSNFQYERAICLRCFKAYIYKDFTHLMLLMCGSLFHVCHLWYECFLWTFFITEIIVLKFNLCDFWLYVIITIFGYLWSEKELPFVTCTLSCFIFQTYYDRLSIRYAIPFDCPGHTIVRGAALLRDNNISGLVVSTISTQALHICITYLLISWKDSIKTLQASFARMLYLTISKKCKHFNWTFIFRITLGNVWNVINYIWSDRCLIVMVILMCQKYSMLNNAEVTLPVRCWSSGFSICVNVLLLSM